MDFYPHGNKIIYVDSDNYCYQPVEELIIYSSANSVIAGVGLEAVAIVHVYSICTYDVMCKSTQMS